MRFSHQLTYYMSWDAVPEHLKTYQQLKGMGLKPFVNKAVARVRVKEEGTEKEVSLYDLNKTIELPVPQIELTEENIAEALYIINKAAKKNRDEANKYKKNYTMANKLHWQKKKLYNLKENAIGKALKEGWAEVKGFQKQIFEDCECFFLSVEIGRYKFHLPVDKEKVKGYPFLGVIEVIRFEAPDESDIFKDDKEARTILSSFVWQECKEGIKGYLH